MATWQARLLQFDYRAILLEDASVVDAYTFWDAVAAYAPAGTLVLLCGTHVELAPFLARNQQHYRHTWHVVSTSTAKSSAKAPLDRVRLIHAFCSTKPSYDPASLQDTDFPGRRCYPSNVIHVSEPPGTIPADVTRFVAALYGVQGDSLLRLLV